MQFSLFHIKSNPISETSFKSNLQIKLILLLQLVPLQLLDIYLLPPGVSIAKEYLNQYLDKSAET